MNEEQLKEFSPKELDSFINKTLLIQNKQIIESKDLTEISNNITSLQNSFNESYANISNITKLLKVKTNITSSLSTKEKQFGIINKQSLLHLNEFNSAIKSLAEHLEKLDLSPLEQEDDGEEGDGSKTKKGKTKTKGKRSKLKRLRAKIRTGARKQLKTLSSSFEEAKGLKGFGRALGVLGAATDIYSRNEEGQSATQIAIGVGGGLVGAEAGATAGAMAGAAIGSVVPVLGTAAGGVVGGLIGGAAGYYGGSAISDYGYGAATQTDAIKVEDSHTDKFADYVNDTFTGVSNWFDSFSWFGGEEKEPAKPTTGTTQLGVESTGPSEFAPMSATSADKKHKTQSWEGDADFIKELNRIAFKFSIDPKDLLGVMQVESGVDPSRKNPNSSATGLIQFMDATATSLGTTTAELRKMTRAQQMFYVEKYFSSVGLRKGSTAAQIYTKVFLPGYAYREVLAVAGNKHYNANKGLDINRDGKITQSELEQKVTKGKQQLGLDKVESVKGNNIAASSLETQTQKKAKLNEPVVLIIQKAGSINSNFSKYMSPGTKPAPKTPPKQTNSQELNSYFLG